jgi:hypothetical protein
VAKQRLPPGRLGGLGGGIDWGGLIHEYAQIA